MLVLRGAPPGQVGTKNTGRLSVVGVPVNMQHMFQQSLVLLSVHQQSGGHSSCMQILVRTVHTVQQTVEISQVQFLAGCGRACCCAMTGALVGRAENCGVSTVAVVLGVVQFLDKVVVPVGATTGGAQCLVRLWIHVLLHPGWLLEDFFTIFLVTGWTRILRSILVVHCSHGR